MKNIILISSMGLLFTVSQICGCGSCEANATNTETTTSINKEEVKTIKLKITGMTCAGCSSHVMETLKSIKGVSKVDLEYPGDVATVEFDASKTNKEALIAAVVKINYKAEEVKSTKTATSTKK